MYMIAYSETRVLWQEISVGRSPRAFRVVALGLLFTALLWNRGHAREVTVAVAANFADALNAISEVFERAEGGRVKPSIGSTGQLYAKIGHGAPYHILLAADTERPRLLIEEGLAEAESRFTYALGRLALWSTDPDRVNGPEILSRGDWRRLAIASPELAPYGLAARQTLQALGLWETVRPKLVQGTNIGQAFQFVATGNAELGFVALSQLTSPRSRFGGSDWRVPKELHEPIRQDAVLLTHGYDDPVARRFLSFLQEESAEEIIRSFGYDLDR